MRNLKRALSLTLASVMLLGMMVVGGSAAEGYPDVDDSQNVEAIEVLQAVGVMGGDNNGNFNPDDYVTREQMAVIMSQLLKLDYNYYKGTNPFSDVPEWAAPYVAACAANGITAGIGDGLYGSKQNIQAVQAALMMLKALGYFQYAGDYEGGYVLATVKLASTVGLFDGIDSESNADLTRNQIAQMVLNALQAEMVTFTGDPGITYTGSNGESWVGGYKAEYTPRTSTQAKYQAIERRTSDVSGGNNLNRGQYYIQLGEELYDGDLRLNDYQVDDFGRPSRQWEYKGNEIGTYVKKELLREQYTAKVTGKNLYDLLTAATIRDYDFTITIDGETEESVLAPSGGPDYGYFTKGNLVRTNTEAVGNTGKGVLTQVFVDPNEGSNGAVYIAIINTYLAIATKDYDTRNEEADFEIYGVRDLDSRSSVTVLVKDRRDKDAVKNGTQPYTEILTVENEDINVEDVKEDDIVLVNVANGEIKVIADPEIISDTAINAFKQGSWVNNGTQYDYAHTAMYDPEVLEMYSNNNMKDVTFNIFLDPYGYMIGLEQNEDPDQYVFITGIDGNTSNLSNRNFDVGAIFLDGRMEVITVNGKDSAFHNTTAINAIVNTWCTYSVNSNGVYTLTEVSDTIVNEKAAQSAQNAYYADNGSTPPTKTSTATGPVTIDKKRVPLVGTTGANEFQKVYGNDETVYLTVSLDIIPVSTEFTKQDNPDGDGGNGSTQWVQMNNTPQKRAAIIDDVVSVNVGVKNVNIEVTDKTEAILEAECETGNNTANDLAFPKDEIYTLYGDDGYVIAAVVIGDDQGTSTQYAYISSGNVTQESYSNANDEWTWHRKAIVNGEEVELTYVGSSLRHIGPKSAEGNMQAGNWYEIRYDANGNVRKATHIAYNSATGFVAADGTANAHKFFSEVLDHDLSGVANDTAILSVVLNGTKAAWDAKGSGDTLTFDENGTMYVTTARAEGFWVDENVKVVVGLSALADLNKTPIDQSIKRDEIKDGYTGRSGLKRALGDLDSNFAGRLSVIFENGAATVIILDDWYGTAVDKGGTTSNGGTYSKATVNVTNKTISNLSYTNGDFRTPVSEAMEAAGFEVTGYNANGTSNPAQNSTLTAVRIGTTQPEYTFTFIDAAPTTYVTVYVDDVETTVASSSTVQGLSGLTADANLYAKYIRGTTTYYTATSGVTAVTVQAGDKIYTDGYLKVNAVPDKTSFVAGGGSDPTVNFTGIAQGAAAAGLVNSITYQVAGKAVTNASGGQYVKLGDKIVVTVSLGTDVVTVAGTSGATITVTGYDQKVEKAATVSSGAPAEDVTATGVVKLGEANGQTYTGGVYSFTKTITAADIGTPAALTVPDIAAANT